MLASSRDSLMSARSWASLARVASPGKAENWADTVRLDDVIVVGVVVVIVVIVAVIIVVSVSVVVDDYRRQRSVRDHGWSRDNHVFVATAPAGAVTSRPLQGHPQGV